MSESADSAWRPVSEVIPGRWVVATIEGMDYGYYWIAALIDNSWVQKTRGEVSWLIDIPTHFAYLHHPPPKKPA